MSSQRYGWTVDVIELPPPSQDDRRSARHTHRVIAVDSIHDRVIHVSLTRDELAAFDPEMHWRGVAGRWAAQR